MYFQGFSMAAHKFARATTRMPVKNDFDPCLIWVICDNFDVFIYYFLFSDACLGDSGGPLIRDFDNEERGTLSYLSGVVSFGNRNCAHGPAVYTRVTAFLEFILNNLGNE